MACPFFSLAKRPRTDAIIYDIGDVYVRVDPNRDVAIATIWDADILIWATHGHHQCHEGRPAFQ